MIDSPVTAIRAGMLTFDGDALTQGIDDTLRFESDAIVLLQDGKILDAGPADSIRVPEGVVVKNYGSDCVICPGFIDTHVHYPQVQIVGGYGEQLMAWLDNYAYPAEQMFADEPHAIDAAEHFVASCIGAGTTTASVFCTVHPQSVDAMFIAAQRVKMRVIAGKVLMDRNAPGGLTDSVQSAYDDSKSLIDKWHGEERLLYALTPRFAGSCSPAQLDMTGKLWAEHPGVYLQSHIAENKAEVEWISTLFPDRQGYLDIYAHFNLLGPRAIYGHGIWLSDSELQLCYDTGTAIAHCPTSNQFLGSGLFDLKRSQQPERPIRLGLATDLGAGTSFSMLQTLNETYKTAQLKGYAMRPELGFYLATRGSARALYLEHQIGSIAPGMEADLVVMDLKSTPVIEHRMQFCDSLAEALFVQITLGDDRAIRATYIAGNCAHERDR